MKQSVSISCLSLLALLSFAQEGARRAPSGPPLQPSAAASQEAARGIEKKDIRALIVYPENVYSPADLQPIENLMQAFIKIELAQASGFSGPEAEMARQIQRRLAAGNGVAVLSVATWPSSAGNKQIQCPPENCGCKNSGVECICSLWQGQCICFLCYEKVELKPFPEDSLSVPRPRGRLANPEQGDPRQFLIAVVAPPDAPAKQRQALLASAVETIQKEPWPARLVIRTKSSPPYHEGAPLPGRQ